VLFSLLLPIAFRRNMPANLVQLAAKHSLGLAEEIKPEIGGVK
jgi:hypothetical protein